MAEIKQPLLEHESWNYPVKGPANNPPSTPSTLERWLVGQSPTGAWVGFAGQVWISKIYANTTEPGSDDRYWEPFTE